MLARSRRRSASTASGSTAGPACHERAAPRIVVDRDGIRRRVFRGRMFIDATYEGDLMAEGRRLATPSAARPTPVRRDAQRRADAARHVPPVRQAGVDPYVDAGRSERAGCCRGIDAGGPGEEGAGRPPRAGLQLPHVPDRRARRTASPSPSPRATTRSGTSCCCATSRPASAACRGSIRPMPNRKTDTNNHSAISTDNIGQNYDYPDGDYAKREQIVAAAPAVPAGPDVDAGQPSRACRRRSARRSAPGAWPRTSSPTTTTGRTSSTCARPGGWSATT